MKKIFFISDVHLHPHYPQRLEQLVAFMRHIEPNTQALYILGDLMDRWIGDDQGLSWLDPLFATSLHWQKNGIPIYFQLGNHDALIGDQFWKKSGMQPIKDPTVLHINEEILLLSHGDCLVPSYGYQIYRHCLHHTLVKKIVLTLPLNWRRAWIQAPHKRKTSARPIAARINQTKAQTMIKKHNATYLIHGHFHAAPQRKKTATAEHIILGDWLNDPHALAWGSKGAVLREVATWMAP